MEGSLGNARSVIGGCVGVWVCGCVGVWVCGCVGEVRIRTPFRVSLPLPSGQSESESESEAASLHPHTHTPIHPHFRLTAPSPGEVYRGCACGRPVFQTRFPEGVLDCLSRPRWSSTATCAGTGCGSARSR